MEKQPVISVAIAAYNGENYIGKQLERLLAQSRVPDEIVICDDSDNLLTAQAIEKFLPDRRIKYFKNPAQLGVNRNFEKALSLCSGDYLFLCDQDDVWLPEKIELMADALSKDSKSDGVFCNSTLVNSELKSLNKTLWDLRKFTRSMQKTLTAGNSLNVFCRRVTCSGHNIAFKRHALDYILPLPELAPFYPDTWIAFAIALNSRWQIINESLTQYRIHTGNDSAPAGNQISAAIKARQCSAAERNYLLAQELIRRSSNADPAKVEQLEKFALFHRKRHGYSSNLINRTLQALQEVCTLHYHRYANGLRTFAADVLFHR